MAMEEVSALHKHPCPECGGDAEWNPSKKALACPFCGTVLPPPASQDFPSAIVEHSLETALAAIPAEARGLHDSRKSVKCESCHAITLFDSKRAAQRCDFCGSPAIVSADGLQNLITPESLLPAIIPETQVREQLRAWYQSRSWAPNKLKKRALTDTLHGIYLPYWTFDAQVSAHWTAESGYHYYVSQSYKDSNGRTRTRQVRKTRWERSAGQLSHFFDDEAVPGTIGVHNPLLRKVEPFPTITDLKPYDPAFLRGWTVERYQVDLRQASETSKQQMDQVIHQLCEREVPGDTHRKLQISSNYQKRSFKHILVPVWLATYTYGRKSYQVLTNGYTGKMAGEHPLSWVKICLAVLAFILLILSIVKLYDR
jgi:ribosomal protein S27E